MRVNTGAVVSEYKGRTRLHRYGIPGCADILAIRNQQRGVDDDGAWCSFLEITPMWLEVKTKTGKQSELQKQFQAEVEAEGHLYKIVRSIDDVEAILR